MMTVLWYYTKSSFPFFIHLDFYTKSKISQKVNTKCFLQRLRNGLFANSRINDKWNIFSPFLGALTIYSLACLTCKW